MAKKTKRQSLAAFARQLGVPPTDAKKVAAHVKKGARAQTQTRRGKHAATLTKVKTKTKEFGRRLKQAHTRVNQVLKKLNDDMQAMQKVIRDASKRVMDDDNPGPKPDPGGQGRP